MAHTIEKDKKLRWWDLLSALLLLAALCCAAGRLISTRWTENLGLTMGLACLGLVLGLMLGQSIFSRGLPFLFSLAYGAILIPWQLGISLGLRISWVERLYNMRGRLGIIINELIQREPVTDNMLFLTLMAALFWFLSVYAGYTLVRHGNPWLAVFPGGLTALVIHSFDPLLLRRSWFLAAYLFFALMLVARLAYLKRRQAWVRSHTHLPMDMGLDWTRFAVLVVAVLLIFSWNAPVFSSTLRPVAELWQEASRPWLSLKDRFGFAFASLRASVGLVSDMYGDSMTLGRGNPLSDQVVFDVEAPFVTPGGVRLYWRARVYGMYVNGTWVNTLSETRPFSAESMDLHQTGEKLRTTAEFTFYPYDVISILMLPPQPLWVSRPGEMVLGSNPDGTVDVGFFQADPFVRPGERYRVRSSLSAVTISALRTAGSDYPDWVVDRYLQLPTDITPRTRELAHQIAGQLDNPYDIAQAVTDYLRNNINYTQTVPEVPAGQERVDWFLFDHREGFCNYYASAEVVLLRSLGIPARLAVGYAQGERRIDAATKATPGPDEGPSPALENKPATYVVRQRDAHAWPEVFFPGIGWIEFEPTTAQIPLARPQGEAMTDNTPEENPRSPRRDQFEQLEPPYQPLDTEDLSVQTSIPWTPRLVALLVLLVVAVVLLALLLWNVRRGFRVAQYLERVWDRLPGQIEQGLLRLGVRPPAFLKRWTAYAALPPLTRAYLEINRALNRLGYPPAVHDTPAERVESLAVHLPPAAIPADVLLANYHASIYSPSPPDPGRALEASKEVRRLSYRALLDRWLARFR